MKLRPLIICAISALSVSTLANCDIKKSHYLCSEEQAPGYEPYKFTLEVKDNVFRSGILFQEEDGMPKLGEKNKLDGKVRFETDDVDNIKYQYLNNCKADGTIELINTTTYYDEDEVETSTDTFKRLANGDLKRTVSRKFEYFDGVNDPDGWEEPVIICKLIKN